MWVRAIKLGYHNHLRRYPADSGKPGGGEPFELVPITVTRKDGTEYIMTPENQFSERWMEKVEAPEAPVSRPTAVRPKSPLPQAAKSTGKPKSTGDHDVI
jgi:hypothetical protein